MGLFLFFNIENLLMNMILSIFFLNSAKQPFHASLFENEINKFQWNPKVILPKPSLINRQPRE
jgi:hypothetical protein